MYLRLLSSTSNRQIGKIYLSLNTKNKTYTNLVAAKYGVSSTRYLKQTKMYKQHNFYTTCKLFICPKTVLRRGSVRFRVLIFLARRKLKLLQKENARGGIRASFYLAPHLSWNVPRRSSPGVETRDSKNHIQGGRGKTARLPVPNDKGFLLQGLFPREKRRWKIRGNGNWRAAFS